MINAQYNYDMQCPDSTYDRMNEFYMDEMETYKNEMLYHMSREFKMPLFSENLLLIAKAIAYSYCEAIPEAKELFSKMNLQTIHADAILENKNDFIYELDLILTERSGAKYD